MACSRVLKQLSLSMASTGRMLCLVGQIRKEAARAFCKRVGTSYSRIKIVMASPFKGESI